MCNNIAGLRSAFLLHTVGNVFYSKVERCRSAIQTVQNVVEQELISFQVSQRCFLIVPLQMMTCFLLTVHDR